jgi:hypothetical protein
VLGTFKSRFPKNLRLLAPGFGVEGGEAAQGSQVEALARIVHVTGDDIENGIFLTTNFGKL